jgi:hypothetical protein
MKNQSGQPSNGIQGVLPAAARGGFYEIHVKGHLDDSWKDWLEGLEFKRIENGEMVLNGRIRDQAALLGILNKLNRLNLALLSVNEIQEGE